ncbi:MAG: hypothetical protein OWV35_03750, partial [Firmicutes bacterium]|nr:hypothetical protein [Bacillota bacterium]
VARARGLSVSGWVREAMQWNLVREGRRAAPAEEQAYIREVFRDVFAGVNFAAVMAQAVLLCWERQRIEALQATEGLPPELARERAQLEVEGAVLEATELFAHPEIQQQYSWFWRDPDTVPGRFQQAEPADGAED